MPSGFLLDQNYPNPFNATTVIKFTLPELLNITLDIYNISGQKVRTLADGIFGAGTQTIIWDGRNTDGEAVASGIYLYRLRAGNAIETRKMVMLK
jgi:flagellar hook assembly protein FlgD